MLLRSRQGILVVCVAIPLALSISMATALFSVADGLISRPLPFREPDRVVSLTFRPVHGTLAPLAYEPGRAADREAIRDRIERSGIVQLVADARPDSSFGEAAGTTGLEVSDVDLNFFETFGLRPAYGLPFAETDQPAEPGPSAIPAVVIGDHVWRSEFGGKRDVLGKQELGGRQVNVVGVMAPGVKFPGETNVWVLVRSYRALLPTFARLAKGATLEQLAAVAPEVEVKSLDALVRPQRGTSLIVIWIAASVLSLVAWVQVGTLVLASAFSRLHEIGVRLALGANRRWLATSLLLENAVVVVGTLGLSWLAARPLTSFVIGRLPAEMIRGQYLEPDARTFLFSCAISVVGLITLTMAPLAMLRRTSPLALLQGRIHGIRFDAGRIRQVFLVTQVTLTSALLFLAGLADHSLERAASFDYGFDSKQVLLFDPPLPGAAPPSRRSEAVVHGDPAFVARTRDKTRRIIATLDALQHTDGVIASSGLFRSPMVNSWNLTGWEDLLRFDGRDVEPGVRINVNSVTQDFVRALGATLVQGRGLDDPESSGTHNIALVNETFVRQFLPTLASGGLDLQISPLGKLFETRQSQRQRIVGVIKDLVYAKVTDAPVSQAFVLDDRAGSSRLIAIRTSRSVDKSLPAVKTTLDRIWGETPSSRFGLLRDSWRDQLRPYSGQAELLSLISVSALLLAAIGLAGFLVYSVRSRWREIAIRAVLGATPTELKRTIIRRAVTIVGLGIVLGGAIGIGAGRLIASQLFMVEPLDLVTVGVVAIILLAVAWVAAWVPARQAARIQPASALRDQ